MAALSFRPGALLAATARRRDAPARAALCDPAWLRRGRHDLMQAAEGASADRGPFCEAVTEAEIVQHAGWRSARARVVELLGAGTLRVAIIGPPGTGKSLLLRSLARTFQSASILFIDAADGSEPAILEVLPKTGPCILAARPAFAECLAGLDSPVVIVPLAPLSLPEVTRFVATRLASAGQPRDMLTPEAILALAGYSGGAPYLINVLAEFAIRLASLDGAPRVTADHVHEAALTRDPQAALGAMPEEGSAVTKLRATVARTPRAASANRRQTALGCAIALTLIVAAGAFTYSRHVPTRSVASAGAPETASPAQTIPDTPPVKVSAESVPALPSPARSATSTPAAAATAPPSPQMTTLDQPAPASSSSFSPPRGPLVLAAHAPRVVIQAQAGNAETDSVAALLAPSYGPVERRVVSETPHRLTIRYFFQSDSAAAHALAVTLRQTGLPWQIQSFVSYRPLPRPGTLEIWIP